MQQTGSNTGRIGDTLPIQRLVKATRRSPPAPAMGR